MICCLIRHGKDDPSLRGGWSQQPLTEEGLRQAQVLAESMLKKQPALQIRQIYSSDLPRALQTAQTLAEALKLPLHTLAAFREANNGALAGLKHELAEQLYPGLYWNTLKWDEKYPGGESPQEFYERISSAWQQFQQNLRENTALVTHSGVIHVILSLISGIPYSNTGHFRPIKHTELILLETHNGHWKEIRPPYEA